MHKADESGPITATKRNRHNELLGGHGNDAITGGDVGDVIWGDYKSPPASPRPSPTSSSAAGDATSSTPATGSTRSTRGLGATSCTPTSGAGSIDCGSGHDTLFISHRAKPGYSIGHCETISFRKGRR